MIRVRFAEQLTNDFGFLVRFCLLVFLIIDLETFGEIFCTNRQLWVRAVWFPRVRTVVLGHLLWVMTEEVGEHYFRLLICLLYPTGHSSSLHGVRWGMLEQPWAMASSEGLGSPWSKNEPAGSVKKGPGDAEELFLKRQRGGTRLCLCGIRLVLFLRA